MLLFFALNALGASPLEVFDQNRSTPWVPGELLVKSSSNLQTMQRMAASRSCSVDRQIGHRPLFVLRCAPGSVPQQIAAFQAMPDIAWVEASFRVEPTSGPPDDYDELMWHLFNYGQLVDGSRGTPLADVGALDAWISVPEADGTVVAVIDSGVYTTHDDLVGRLWTNPADPCGDLVDDDGNGYVDDCAGWDSGEQDGDADPHTIDGDSCVNWSRGHGTFIAGLIAAPDGDGTGVVGLAPGATVMPIKILTDADCNSSSTAFTEAVAYAIDNGAQIMNMSFTSGAYSALFEDLLQESDTLDILTVVASGNDGQDLDGFVKFPQWYDWDNRLIVANSTNKDLLYSSSNYGATMVDIAAPGTDLRSAGIDDPTDYRLGTGTSYAAPLVGAAAALVWTAHPALSGAQVRDALTMGAEPLIELDCRYTPFCVRDSGRLSVPGALAVAEGMSPTEGLQLMSWRLDDDGGDGQLQWGEVMTLHLVVEARERRFEGIVATLLHSPDIIRHDDIRQLGALDPAEQIDTELVSRSLTFEMGSCGDGEVLWVDIRLEDATGVQFVESVPVQRWCAFGAPELIVSDAYATDSSSESRGDADGVVELGERVELEIDFENVGDEPVIGVEAWIRPLSPFVHVTDNHTEGVNLEAGEIGGTTATDHDFDFEVVPGCDADFDAEFAVTIADFLGHHWHDQISIPVVCIGESTDLELSVVEVRDPDTDGLFEPGEDLELIVAITNPNAIDVDDVEIKYRGVREVWVGDLPGGLTMIYDDQPITVHVDEDCVDNTTVDVELTVVDGWARSWTMVMPIALTCNPDTDGDGSEVPDDCDDADPAVHRAADELCNGVDDDCNGLVDDDPIDGIAWHADEDQDGTGDPNRTVYSCEPVALRVDDASDCDDDDATRSRNAHEICNGVDDDCDSVVDEGCEDEGRGCSVAPVSVGWFFGIILAIGRRASLRNT